MDSNVIHLLKLFVKKRIDIKNFRRQNKSNIFSSAIKSNSNASFQRRFQYFDKKNENEMNENETERTRWNEWWGNQREGRTAPPT